MKGFPFSNVDPSEDRRNLAVAARNSVEEIERFNDLRQAARKYERAMQRMITAAKNANRKPIQFTPEEIKHLQAVHKGAAAHIRGFQREEIEEKRIRYESGQKAS